MTTREGEGMTEGGEGLRMTRPDSFQVTVEPAGGAGAPSGPVVIWWAR
jgi:anti-sigma-K factor RskA